MPSLTLSLYVWFSVISFALIISVKDFVQADSAPAVSNTRPSERTIKCYDGVFTQMFGINTNLQNEKDCDAGNACLNMEVNYSALVESRTIPGYVAVGQCTSKILCGMNYCSQVQQLLPKGVPVTLHNCTRKCCETNHCNRPVEAIASPAATHAHTTTADTNDPSNATTTAPPTTNITENGGESSNPDAGTCLGTNSGLSYSIDKMNNYIRMRNRYNNCKIVKGNLEIVGLDQTLMDMSFLKDIEEVTGYVLIALNNVSTLPLENLKIIRGRELYEDHYALYITLNYNFNDSEERLIELRMKSLTEIVQGGVYINHNELCFANTIQWNDILNANTFNDGWNVNVISKSAEFCGNCDSSCPAGCWGQGPTMCQKLTKTICSNECGVSRCRGPNQQDCCHPQCAVGCTGPTERDCMVCLNVNNSGSCLESCPEADRYNPETKRYEPNPAFRYLYSDQCVDRCPDNLLVEDNACVKTCRVGYDNDGSGKCTRNLNSFDRECFGVGQKHGPLAKDRTLHSMNIHHFEGCNIVKGNVIFQTYAFVGDSYTKIPPMNITKLYNAFKNVKVIQGYVEIMGWSKELVDFSVFKNLQKIEGIELFQNFGALIIQDNAYKGPYVLNQITSLGFSSLKAIGRGNVYIGYMRSLCYTNTVKWSSIIKNPVSYNGFREGLLLRRNKPASQCKEAICDPICSIDGCWGPGVHQCLTI